MTAQHHHTVTVQWLQHHRTAKGGWTKRQLELVGVAWPPAAGWQAQAAGRQVPAAAAAEFEAIAAASRGGAK